MGILELTKSFISHLKFTIAEGKEDKVNDEIIDEENEEE